MGVKGYFLRTFLSNKNNNYVHKAKLKTSTAEEDLTRLSLIEGKWSLVANLCSSF